MITFKCPKIFERNLKSVTFALFSRFSSQERLHRQADRQIDRRQTDGQTDTCTKNNMVSSYGGSLKPPPSGWGGHNNPYFVTIGNVRNSWYSR